VPSVEITSARKKGKAVLLIHTWKDHLWDMGSKPEVPEDTVLTTSNGEVDDPNSKSQVPTVGEAQWLVEGPAISPAAEPTLFCASGQSEPPESVAYTPQEVTELLNLALIQAISENLSSLPSSTFPMSATTLYSNYLLPNRPAFPTRVLAPANLVTDEWTTNDPPPSIETEITIKSSSQKSLTSFLKAAEKHGLLTLKAPQKQQPDVLVTSVNASHPNVASHESFVTVRKLELKAAKKAAREEKQKEAEGSWEVQVKELYKPHQSSAVFFEGIGARFGSPFMINCVNIILSFRNHL
jgi:translation initiation factor 2D